jgi:hypothetical protein
MLAKSRLQKHPLPKRTSSQTITARMHLRMARVLPMTLATITDPAGTTEAVVTAVAVAASGVVEDSSPMV